MYDDSLWARPGSQAVAAVHGRSATVEVVGAVAVVLGVVPGFVAHRTLGMSAFLVEVRSQYVRRVGDVLVLLPRGRRSGVLRFFRRCGLGPGLSFCSCPGLFGLALRLLFRPALTILGDLSVSASTFLSSLASNAATSWCMMASNSLGSDERVLPLFEPLLSVLPCLVEGREVGYMGRVVGVYPLFGESQPSGGRPVR